MTISRRVSLILTVLLLSVSTHASPCADELRGHASGARLKVTPEFIVDDALEVPVFSDVHGNLEGLFRAIGDLQVQRKRRFPVILVTGDFGFFPSLDRISEDVQRHELKSEAAYSLPDYFASDALYQEYFAHHRGLRRLNGQILFLRGNHEDQAALRELSDGRGGEIVPVDSHGVLRFLTDGTIVRLSWPGSRVVRIAVFGGIHPESRPKASARDPLVGFDDAALDHLLEGASKLRRQHRRLDLLLTHQSGLDMPGGHQDIDALRELLNPRFHFSGHGHRFIFGGDEAGGRPTRYQLKNLGRQPLPPRGTGDAVILQINKSGKINVVEGV